MVNIGEGPHIICLGWVEWGGGMKTGPHQPQRIQNSTTHKTWGVEGVKVTYFTLGVQW